MTFRNFLCVFFIVLVQAFFCVGAVWADPATPPAPSLWAAFQHVIFLSLLVFFVFYLMVLRPQATKLQQHAKLIESLKKGDQVTTAGGLIGRVASVESDHVVLEIAQSMKVKFEKSKVVNKFQSAASA